MTWGDIIIDAPKNYSEKRNMKAAEVVNILVQLEGMTEERAFTLLLRSQFGMALINEITKAWHYPEYWAYVSICREMDMEPKPPAPEGIIYKTSGIRVWSEESKSEKSKNTHILSFFCCCTLY